MNNPKKPLKILNFFKNTLLGIILGGIITTIVFIPMGSEFFRNLVRDWQETAKITKIDENFKMEITKELKRNIRILQFYIYCIKNNWQGNLTMTRVSDLYTDFIKSKNILLTDSYQVSILADIERIYQKFGEANKRIEQINSVSMTRNRTPEENIDYFTRTINESIKLFKKIVVDKNGANSLNKSYLGKNWDTDENLESNSLEFIKQEDSSVATSTRRDY
jgi:hypothetical protein